MPVQLIRTGRNAGCFEVKSGSITELSSSPATIFQSYANGERIDALKNNSTWQGLVNQPVRITGGDDLCWRGGVIKGDWTTADSWDTLHNTGAFQIRGNPRRLHLEHLRVHNYGDGFQSQNPTGVLQDQNRDGFVVRGCRFNNCRDDGFQNDFGTEGLIDDCFFDKIYSGYSSRPFNEFVGDNSAKIVTIRDCLWHLVDMPDTFHAGIPGHAKFFKMDNDIQLGWPGYPRDPKLRLIRNVMRVDTLHEVNTDFMIPPPDRAESVDNIMVWGGAGGWPYETESGWTITTDTTVWDNAKAQWMARHPLVNQEPDFEIPPP